MFFKHTKSMKKRSKEQVEILKQLASAEPNEVGRLLKKYFNLKKKN